MFKTLFLATLAASLAIGQTSEISGERIRAHVRFLSSDLLEGRGTGTRGGDLAAEYIASQFALIGAKPAGDAGTYFQKVPLLGVTTLPSATLAAQGGGKSESFAWLNDFVGVTQQQKADAQVDAEAIFVGHGIVAPEFQWDDFKGVDVKGKFLVLFTNEPPSEDPAFFGGKALTYYGRWTYKLEQGARMGAAGVLIIHTTPTAGYSYAVVQGSWGRENAQIRLAPDAKALAFAGWISQEAGGKLLALAGKSVDELLTAANSRDFQPIPLGIRIRANLPSKLREMESKNVAAIIPGSDPKLKGEAVVFSAHWDHLGIGPAVNGDSIYNGAVDNATGCGVLIEMARAWAGLKQKPRRSGLFVAVTAEEAGDLGADYFGEHPPVPMGKMALNLNFDSYYPFGATKDVFVTGADRTTVWPTVLESARRMSMEIKPDPHPEQGAYYRSDHFSFARLGVPAFSVELGSTYYGKPADYGEKIFEEYNDKHYHSPSDEYREDWNFAGMEQAAKFGFLIGSTVGNQDKLPTWKAGDEFLPAREKSLGK
jgi:Zn-dependent M28 family amino/carboxypeptidase